VEVFFDEELAKDRISLMGNLEEESDEEDHGLVVQKLLDAAVDAPDPEDEVTSIFKQVVARPPWPPIDMPRCLFKTRFLILTTIWCSLAIGCRYSKNTTARQKICGAIPARSYRHCCLKKQSLTSTRRPVTPYL